MSTGFDTDEAAGRNERSSLDRRRVSSGPRDRAIRTRPRKDPQAAGVRDDRDAVARGHRLVRQERRHVEQLLERSVRITPVWRNRASTVDVRGGEQRSRVRRGRRALPAARPPALDGDDRLASDRRAGRAGRTSAGSRRTRGTAARHPCRGPPPSSWSRSLPEMSALFPTDTNVDRPKPELARPDPSRRCRGRRSGRGTRRGPPAGMWARTCAFRRMSGSVLTTPMQFGPDEAHPGARQTVEQVVLERDPSGPVSANPDEMTTSPRTPLLAALARDGDHGRRRGRR